MRSRSAYLNRPSVASRSVPSFQAASNGTGRAALDPKYGLCACLRVRSSTPVGGDEPRARIAGARAHDAGRASARHGSNDKRGLSRLFVTAQQTIYARHALGPDLRLVVGPFPCDSLAHDLDGPSGCGPATRPAAHAVCHDQHQGIVRLADADAILVLLLASAMVPVQPPSRLIALHTCCS